MTSLNLRNANDKERHFDCSLYAQVSYYFINQSGSCSIVITKIFLKEWVSYSQVKTRFYLEKIMHNMY